MGAGFFRQGLASPGARLSGVGVMPTPLHTPTLKKLISSQHVEAGKTSSVSIPTIKQGYRLLQPCFFQVFLKGRRGCVGCSLNLIRRGDCVLTFPHSFPKTCSSE